MLTKILSTFLGRECNITLHDDNTPIKGILISVDEKWIRVEEKKKVRIINGEMIRDISFSKQ
ncbi:MAG: hypothetical protein IJZ94_02720 [Clostridia bacterium]|nr:hypothetical protein [Clostridia bacterium]